MVEIYGTGKESRDFLYVSDLVRAVEIIINKSELNGSIYNLASGTEKTIEDVVEIYFNALGFKGQYEFNGKGRAGDPLNWRADIQKMIQLGFQPSVSIGDGLQEVAVWMNRVASVDK